MLVVATEAVEPLTTTLGHFIHHYLATIFIADTCDDNRKQNAMIRWVSLEPGWKLQNVQAGLNVIIAFICAGGVFVLVRYCWLLAARQVTRNKDVPATALLSLNTVGESIDIIWLMRKDLFSRRYRGLLLQCISVMLLTVAALMSGFIARFSTRYGTVLMDRVVNGTIAQQLTGGISYAEVDTNATLYSLKTAHFPPNQLLEYLPNLDHRWEYDSTQWNSSWRLDCKYNESVVVPNVVSTGNCTGLLSEIPQIADNWIGWNPNNWHFENTAWRNNFTAYRDVFVFSHGIEVLERDKSLNNNMISGRVRTVVLHLEGVPFNTSLDKTRCTFAEGPVQRASYTSMTCKMNRAVANRTKEDAFWGANPDASHLTVQTISYVQHYANNIRKQSSRELPITPPTGDELVMFYQAYMATKDTSNAPYVQRTISEYVEVAQISIVTLIVCSVAAAIILFGLINYWIFVLQNWNHISKTPQSKLDWMLRTLRKEGEDDHNMEVLRQKLKAAMASGQQSSESVLLNNMTPSDRSYNRKRPGSVTSSTVEFATPELERGDDGFETPILGSNFSGSRPSGTWFPQSQQYQRVGTGGAHARQESFGLGVDYARSSNTQYTPAAPVQRSEDARVPKVWAGTHHVDTMYDPGRW